MFEILFLICLKHPHLLLKKNIISFDLKKYALWRAIRNDNALFAFILYIFCFDKINNGAVLNIIKDVKN